VSHAQEKVNHASHRRVNEIDLLRLIAALGVVLFHYAFFLWISSPPQYPYLAPYAKYGYLGVQLFFMISGFVIVMSATRESLKTFLISRAVRLYPAFWACCTLTFLVVTLVFGKRSFSETQYFLNMTMLSGFIGVPPIDSVYWTLFVEMRFYAIVALILAFGKLKQVETLLIVWALASIVLYWCTENPIVRLLQILLITRYSAYFIAGTTFFLIWSRGFTLLRGSIICAMWLLGAVNAIAEIPEHAALYQSPMSAIAVGATVSTFFALMLLIALRMTGFWGIKSWSVAGSLSYPLYLIHGQIGYIIFDRFLTPTHRYLFLAAVVMTALFAAYCVNKFIERRFAPIFKYWLEYMIGNIQSIARRFAG